MKERIEFITESTTKGRKEIAKINEYVNNFNFDCGFKRKIEQVPENFGELKELCEANNIDIMPNYIYAFGLSFFENGNIEDVEGSIVAENRTPQQMWQIIKSLTESLGTNVEKNITYLL